MYKDEQMLWPRRLLDIKNGLAFVVSPDLTPERQHLEDLHCYYSKVRALTAKTILSEERERRMVAIGLHDRVGHRLACAKFKAATLLARQTLSCDEIKDALADICAEIDQAIRATRDLTADLSSPTLYDLGLDSALRALSEQTTSYSGLEITVDAQQIPKSMPQDTVIIVHRVARELLFNVVKHARAKRAVVTLEVVQGYLQLTVTDDGVGLAGEPVSRPAGGFGLFSIREQIREMDGSFHIARDPSGGTRALVRVPI